MSKPIPLKQGDQIFIQTPKKDCRLSVRLPALSSKGKKCGLFVDIENGGQKRTYVLAGLTRLVSPDEVAS